MIGLLIYLLTLTANPMQGFAPLKVTLKTQVADNVRGAICLMIESDNGYSTSSCWNVNGTQAPSKWTTLVLPREGMYYVKMVAIQDDKVSFATPVTTIEVR